jgi:hypothetical protein
MSKTNRIQFVVGLMDVAQTSIHSSQHASHNRLVKNAVLDKCMLFEKIHLSNIA